MHLDIELVRADRPELARLELGEPRSLQGETDASVLVGLPVADLRALHRLTAPAVDDRELERVADARRLRSAELEELPAEPIEGDQDAVVRLDLLLAAADGEVLVVQLEAPELAAGRRVRPDPVDEEVLERGRPRASPGHAREPCTVVEPAGDSGGTAPDLHRTSPSTDRLTCGAYIRRGRWSTPGFRSECAALRR